MEFWVRSEIGKGKAHNFILVRFEIGLGFPEVFFFFFFFRIFFLLQENKVTSDNKLHTHKTTLQKLKNKNKYNTKQNKTKTKNKKKGLRFI